MFQLQPKLEVQAQLSVFFEVEFVLEVEVDIKNFPILSL